MKSEEVVISIDVETDGPIAGRNSMLALGAAAFDPKILPQKPASAIRPVKIFSINLKELPDCHPDPKTKKWWNQHPQAWSVIHKNQKPPEQAMRDFELWLRGLNVRPIFMAWPATFDFPFVEYYAQRFLGKSLFGHSGICARSFAMAHLKEKSWLSQNISMRYFYKKWPPTEKSLKHDPLNDAIRQGELFCRVLIANQNGK